MHSGSGLPRTDAPGCRNCLPSVVQRHSADLSRQLRGQCYLPELVTGLLSSARLPFSDHVRGTVAAKRATQATADSPLHACAKAE